VRAIDDNAQAVEPQPLRKALLDELDVAAGRIVEPLARPSSSGPARRFGPLPREASIFPSNSSDSL